jgi:hydrogenase-4 component B
VRPNDITVNDVTIRGPVSTRDYVYRDGTRYLRIALVVLSGIATLGMYLAIPLIPPSRIARIASDFSHYPLALLLLTIAAGPVVAKVGKRISEHARDVLLLLIYVASLLMIIAMFPQVRSGYPETTIPGVLGYGLHFRVDMLSWIMLIVSSVLWFIVGLYARDYMPIEHHRDRFYIFFMLTYAGVLGTVMASDILTLFLFFELMTFASYLLVAHKETTDSIMAGSRYIFMGIAGGLTILLGIVLMQFHTSHLDFALLAQDLRAAGPVQYAIAGLLIMGFGLKAGMLPLHIWLPRAHPVAPTPASALLSGLLIKTGTYGILRVATSFFMPGFEVAGSRENPLWALSHNEGTILIWVGIATMAVGVFMALQQSDMKKMLAYHSISQMGYIIMGIGVASYLGYIGAMGFAGSVFHTMNHALFKSLLFLVVGVIYLNTGQTDMYKLGGLWRRMPVTALVCLVAALGITGMPGFNGFASKSILHHAIDEAWHYGHYSFRSAEMMFTVVSAGTVGSFIKFYYYIFLRKPTGKGELYVGKVGSGTMQIAMSISALLIVLIGLFPDIVMNALIIPATRTFNYDPVFVDTYLEGMVFFNRQDLWNVLVVYLLGGLLFITGVRFGLFHLHLPRWLHLEHSIYGPIMRYTRRITRRVYNAYAYRINASDAYIYTVIVILALLTAVGAEFL